MVLSSVTDRVITILEPPRFEASSLIINIPPVPNNDADGIVSLTGSVPPVNGVAMPKM